MKRDNHASPDASTTLHLLLTVLAFAMEFAAGYGAILMLGITAWCLGLVFYRGVGGGPIAALIGEPKPLYKVKWACTERCGLEHFDWVFFWYCLISVIALGAAALSIITKLQRFHSTDAGSWVLAITSLCFVPLSWLFVYLPYFTTFPRERLDYCDKSHTPNPWPFGSQGVGLGVFGLVSAASLASLAAAIRLAVGK